MARVCAALWVLCVAGFSFGQAQLQAAPAARDGRWRQDIQYLVTNLERLHKDGLVNVSRADFERAARTLEAGVPNLSDSEVIVGMMKLVALLHDSHTNLTKGLWRFHSYPLVIENFRGGWFVIRTNLENKALLGKKLIAIGGTPISDVYKQVLPVVAHDNPYWPLHQAPMFMVSAEVLQALGTLPDVRQGSFTFADARGPKTITELTPIPFELNHPKWPLAMQKTPLWLENTGKPFWSHYLPDSQTLYVAYNKCKYPSRFLAFTAKVFASIGNHPVARLVIDLRNNGGGDSAVFAPFLARLKDSPLNRSGHLFVIIGPGTFSSAVDNAVQLKIQTHAIFVGQPTGGRPDSYGNVRTFTLPNSKLSVDYTTAYFHDMPGNPPALMPDIEVNPSFADFAAGRDPAMKATLNYPANP